MRKRTAAMTNPTAYLDRARISYTWERHAPAHTAQDLAKILGISGYQVAKAVVIGADEGVWMAVLPAPEVVDLQRLASLLSVKSVRLLDEGEFSPLFPGCEVGAAPPFGKLYNVPIVLDGDLAAEPEIVFRAGSHSETIRMRLRDFTQLESPLIADFSVLPDVPNETQPSVQVAEVMTSPVSSCWADDPLSVPAKLMWDRDCGAIPVISRHSGETVAMITDRDICMATLTRDRPPSAIRVDEAMSRALFACAPTDPISHAEAILREHRVRRLPVLDGDRRLVGLLSLADIVRVADRDLSRAVKAVAAEDLTDVLGVICQPRSTPPVALRGA